MDIVQDEHHLMRVNPFMLGPSRADEYARVAAHHGAATPPSQS